MVTRRRFAAVLGAVALGPVSGLAQDRARVWRIGFLSLDTAASVAGQQAVAEFPAAMARLGYREGRNVVIEWRWADGKTGELRELATGLVRSKVDVIVARTNDPIRAAMDATRTIPIVMLNGNFPAETGLVASLARPGGNVTGTAYISAETMAKALQLLKEFVPGARRVAILWANASSTSRHGPIVQGALDRAAGDLRLQNQYFEIRRPDDMAAALDGIASGNFDALYYLGSPIVRTRLDEIIAMLNERKMPSISTIPLFAERGGLAHYAPDVGEFFERTAEYVDRILRGANPANLPVQQPTKYEFVINLRTAAAIGIRIPPAVLDRADRRIES